jgi:hypothetical protein
MYSTTKLPKIRAPEEYLRWRQIILQTLHKYVNSFVLRVGKNRKNLIGIYDKRNKFTNFKYGNLFEEMANSSENDNITIIPRAFRNTRQCRLVVQLVYHCH